MQLETGRFHRQNVKKLLLSRTALAPAFGARDNNNTPEAPPCAS
jgi:hypothetical protein